MDGTEWWPVHRGHPQHRGGKGWAAQPQNRARGNTHQHHGAGESLSQPGHSNIPRDHRNGAAHPKVPPHPGDIGDQPGWDAAPSKRHGMWGAHPGARGCWHLPRWFSPRAAPAPVLFIAAPAGRDSAAQKPPVLRARSTDNPCDKAASLLEMESPRQIPLVEEPDGPGGRRPGQSAALLRRFIAALLIVKAKRH